jgi:cysteine-S-conjugate beta-lyase
MLQNFNENISREGTHCYKYDLRAKIFGADDVYPMWVADTDFRAPDFIINALQERLNHGIFGYTVLDDEYFNSIINWVKHQHGYAIKKEWIKYSPGVVPSLFGSVLAFTEPNDKVIVQTPVYFPFYSAVKETGRKLVRNPLVLREGRYEMDFDDLKGKIDTDTKMLILCSPHNPTGNVWREEELRKLCEICLENKILIISDEIHADIIYKGHKHIPTASLSNEIANNMLTLMAPSKTFNIAGLSSSYVFSSNNIILEKFSKYVEGLHISANIFAIEATKAAYNFGKDWLKELNTYYFESVNLVRDFVNSRLKNIDLIEPEGTFLLWLDFRKTNLSRKEINKILIESAKLGLNDGYMFGAEGEGFQRMNIGCPKDRIYEALVGVEKTNCFSK